jgi:beta-glucanase (GH16 family)
MRSTTRRVNTKNLPGRVLAAAILSMSCGSANRPTAATPTPAPAASGPATFTLFWSDEFDAPSGTPIDPTKWKHDVGGGGWGNNQLEYDTASVSNVSHDGDGHLVITARRERFSGPDAVTRDYTSARINTAGRFEHAYGRFEARIQLPVGQGIWPAFWLLGADIGRAGWPACGEIDIMENVGHEPSNNHGSLHGPGYSGATPMTGIFRLPGGQRFTDDFHVFAIEWEPAAVRWYVDGALYQTRTPSSLPSGTRWVFDHPFFIILNVAVGGNWPGSPDATTLFPQEMRVDWVRVYRLN